MSKILLMERSFLKSFLSARFENEKKVTGLLSSEDMQKSAGDIFSALGIDKSDFNSDSISRVVGSTMEIDIHGLLTPSIDIVSAFFAEPQTLYSSILGAINKAELDPSIEKIQLNINSSGGYVSGCDEAGTAIANSFKKVVAVVSDMAASAGYWLASQADEIIAKSAADEFGSIGVAVEIYDYTGYFDSLGIKHYSLVSENAENKRPDVSKEDGRQEIIDRLTQTEEVFHSRVASGRGTTIDDVKKNYGRGAVFVSSKALSVGMIDGVINGIKDDFSPSTSGKINKNKKEMSMNELMEFLAKNPEAKAEYEKAIAEAGKAGEKKANARAEKAAAFISASYPEAIHNMAKKVMKGEAMEETLEAMVSMHEMSVENKASEAAKNESAQQLDTPPAAADDTQASLDGTVEKEADFQAMIKRTKGVL